MRNQFQLVGRQLQHVDAAEAERIQFQRRNAEIAADRALPARMLEQMRRQRGGGGFSVGAGDRDNRRVRLRFQQQVDIAHQGNVRGARLHRQRMRLGMRMRNARAPDNGFHAIERAFAARHGGPALCHGGRARRGIVVPHDHLGAARTQSRGRAEPGLAEAHHQHAFACETEDWDHATSASRC